MQFSKILKFNKLDRSDRWASYQYAVSQELFQISFEDKFSSMKNFFKSPLSLFYSTAGDVNDVNRYLTRLLKGFKSAYHRATLNMPLRKGLFNLPIDDALFERYSSERFEQDRKAPVNSNYKREYDESSKLEPFDDYQD